MTILALIGRFGLPLAQALLNLAQNHTGTAQEFLDHATLLINKTEDQYKAEAAARAAAAAAAIS